MKLTIKSNIEPQKLTVTAGGAKKVELKSVAVQNEVQLKAMIYPNVTVNQGTGTGNSADHDGLVNGTSYLAYYTLAKN